MNTDLVKIKSIKKIDSDSKRYDIQIKKNHNFFANGILVHNCTMMYFDKNQNKWCVQTLKQIEAEENVTSFDGTSLAMSYADLFWNVFYSYNDLLDDTEELLNSLDKNYTYIFELCTSKNRIVIDYGEDKLFFLGMRNNTTLKEDYLENSVLSTIFDIPKTFDFKTLKEVKDAALQLTKNEEGYIVMDKNFRRLKIKGKAYIAEHYLRTGVRTYDLVNVVFENEEDEFLLTFPEHRENILEIKKVLLEKSKQIDLLYATLSKSCFDKKEFAVRLKTLENNTFGKQYMFPMFNGKIKNGIEALRFASTPEMKVKKIRDFLKYL